MARQGGAVFGARLVGRVLRFVAQLILGRMLGPIGFGAFVLGRAIQDVLKTYGGLGLERAAIRFTAVRLAASDQHGVDRLVRMTLGASLLASVAGAALLYAFAAPVAVAFGDPTLTAGVRAFAIGLPFLVLLATASGLIRGARRVATDIAIQEIVQPALHLLLLVAMLALGSRSLGMAIGTWNVSLVAAALVALLVVHRTFPSGLRRVRAAEPAPSWSSEGEVWRFSMAQLLIGTGTLVITRLDRLSLGGVVSMEELGLYGAAYMISQQNSFFLGALNTAFAPQVAALHARGEMAELGYLLKLLNRWTALATVPLVIICVALAQEVMGLMGTRFVAGGLMLAILSMGQLVNSVTGSVGVLLNMSGNQRLEVMNMVATVLLLPSLILLLTPRYGAVGTAAAVAISIAAVNIARVVEVWSALRIHPFEGHLWGVAAAGAVAVGAWAGVDRLTGLAGMQRLALGSAVIVAAYAVVAAVVALGPEDRAMAAQLVQRQRGRGRRGGGDTGLGGK